MKNLEINFEFPIKKIVEGYTEVYIPDLDKYRVGKKIEPAHAPVFYNPEMISSRTISVIAIEAYRRMFGLNDLIICEPLAGTGVRGIDMLKKFHQ